MSESEATLIKNIYTQITDFGIPFDKFSEYLAIYRDIAEAENTPSTSHEEVMQAAQALLV